MALREDLGHVRGISSPAFTASACLLELIKEVYKAFLLSIDPWTPGLYAKKNRDEPNSISWQLQVQPTWPPLLSVWCDGSGPLPIILNILDCQLRWRHSPTL